MTKTALITGITGQDGGYLTERRDWGYAGDYVRAMYLIVQAEQPDDYVIATGESHSVREFCEYAFARVGLDYRDYVRHDPALVHMMVDAEVERIANHG